MKPDASEIKAVVDELAGQKWLGRLRSRWVDFSFHFSEITNAVEILNSGKVRCRTDLERDGALPVDIACADIISQTHQEIRDSVRLYFRPLTPTQFNMEGFRPKYVLSRNSHCRVPIFFLFDSREILCREDSRFSQVNLAILGTKDGLCSTAAELKEFNFRDIYHDGPFSAENRSRIIGHRNAEIVIPRELDLAALRFICCRSQAEKETFIDLLPTELVKVWGGRIYVSPNLYRRNWVFIETAMLTGKEAVFMFSPDAEIPEPFFAEVIVRPRNAKTKTFRKEGFKALKNVTVPFGNDLSVYKIEFKLDGHIAYSGRFDSGLDDIPF
jgi:hypothetical protein